MGRWTQNGGGRTRLALGNGAAPSGLAFFEKQDEEVTRGHFERNICIGLPAQRITRALL